MVRSLIALLEVWPDLAKRIWQPKKLDEVLAENTLLRRRVRQVESRMRQYEGYIVVANRAFQKLSRDQLLRNVGDPSSGVFEVPSLPAPLEPPPLGEPEGDDEDAAA